MWFFVSIASNGTMITPDRAAQLKAAGVDYVEISLDGATAASHDALRGIRGCYDRAVRGVQSCTGAGLFTCVATTVTRDNFADVPRIHALAASLGAQRMMCFNFIPTGRGVGIIDQDLLPRQRDQLLQWILDVDQSTSGPLVLSTALQFARVAVEKETGGVPVVHFHPGMEMNGKTAALAEFIGGCGAGRIYCSIEPDGTVQPCVFMPVSVGNLRNTSFAVLWHNSPVMLQLRDRDNLEGNCGTCPTRLVCGGCRARAWAYFNDLNAPDPGCVRNQALWDALHSVPGAITTQPARNPEGVPARVIAR